MRTLLVTVGALVAATSPVPSVAQSNGNPTSGYTQGGDGPSDEQRTDDRRAPPPPPVEQRNGNSSGGYIQRSDGADEEQRWEDGGPPREQPMALGGQSRRWLRAALRWRR